MSREERECPWCAETILARARVCKFCGRDVEPLVHEDRPAPAAPAPTPPPVPATPAPRATPPQGVGGWLIVFAVTQVMAVIWNLAISYTAWSALAAARATSARSIGGELRLAAWIGALLVVGGVVGLHLLFTRHRDAPAYWCRFLAAALLLFLLRVVLCVDAAGVVDADALLGAADPWPAVGIALWLGYWIRSKRVAATWGYNGFRRGPDAPGYAGPSAWRGPAISGAAALVIALFGLMGDSDQPVRSGSVRASLAAGGTESPASIAADTIAPVQPQRLERLFIKYLPLLDGVADIPADEQGFARFGDYHEQMEDGVTRLSDRDLIAYIQAIGAAYSALPQAACADVLGRDSIAGDDALDASLARLDSASQDAYARGSVLALRANLQRVPKKTVTEDDAKRAMIALFERLEPAERERLGAFFENPTTASRADKCWATRFLLTRTPQLISTRDAAALLRYTQSDI